jgi:hypothetical protein
MMWSGRNLADKIRRGNAIFLEIGCKSSFVVLLISILQKAKVMPKA